LRDDLLFHYERELTYLRYMGADFARKYPKVASRLLLESGKCDDPHVERILEGFAFLAARVYQKIDDEFPEIVESLISILYPHYLRPIPSASIAQFNLDPDQGKLTSGFPIPKDSMLYSAPVGGTPCKFRTCYDTVIWPLRVTAADWRNPDRVESPISAPGSVAVLRLELECFRDVNFSKLDLQTLRFYLSGDGSMVHGLIELLCNNCMEIVVRDTAHRARKKLSLRPSAIRQVGYGADEGLLPLPRRSFWAYRLLQEYFTFPEKFCFLDLSGFDEVARNGFGEKIELLFYLSEFERSDRRQTFELGVSRETFRLGCAPIVNVFKQVAEPILLEQKKFDYRVITDARREHALDIFSVDEVVGMKSGSPDLLTYEPFYSYRHSSSGNNKQAFWHLSRRPSGWRTDKTFDTYLHFVDLTGQNVTPDRDTVTVRLTCSNGELPSRLPFGNESGDFHLQNGGPINRIIALTKPTAALQTPAQKGLLWRLISQLSLNYLSLVNEGADALREILRLNNFTGSLSAEKQIDGILNLESTPHFARLISDHGVTFARGTRIDLEIDEDQFAGTGAYTFAGVLDVFFGLYTSMNSFSQLRVRTPQRKRMLNRWPPRSGTKVLI
jgi:type VI secretion system protein ImpG